jgi:hypothetical protein
MDPPTNQQTVQENYGLANGERDDV